LIQRHLIGSSTYRASHFGAEQFVDRDREYTGRNSIDSFDAERRMYRLAKFLANFQLKYLTERIQPSVMQAIARTLGCRAEDSPSVFESFHSFSTYDSESKPPNKLPAEFDVRWLEPPSVTFRDSWCGVHKWLSENILSDGNSVFDVGTSTSAFSISVFVPEVLLL
jgi:hypothetical protein